MQKCSKLWGLVTLKYINFTKCNKGAYCHNATQNGAGIKYGVNCKVICSTSHPNFFFGFKANTSVKIISFNL